MPLSILLIYQGDCPMDKLISRADTPRAWRSLASRRANSSFVMVLHCRLLILSVPDRRVMGEKAAAIGVICRICALPYPA